MSTLESDINKKLEELRESESQFQQLFDGISPGFALCELIYDKQGNPADYRFLKINPAFEKQTELKVESVIGKTVKEIYPNIEQCWIDRYGSVVITNSPLHFIEYNHNTNKYYSVNSFSLSESRFAILFEDITEKRQSEENLRESEKQYKQLFNSMNEMFQVIELIYDINGNATDYYYLQVNPAFEKLVNKKKEELIGKRAKEIFGIVEDHWINTYERVDKTGNPESYENYGAELDKYFNINSWKVDEKIIAITFTDITEKKNSEIKLKAALEKALESDKLKSAFLSNMSHEIRTPMNSILGFSNLLKKPNLPDEKKEKYIAYIESGGKRLLTLISDIVDISKIDAHQLTINLYPFNLNALIDNLHSQFSIDLNDSEISFNKTSALSDHSSFIITDEVRLMQVLSNLIENAQKFTKKGKIEFGYTRKGKFLQFFVKDTGIGIDPLQHEYIFERFRQITNEQDKFVSGSGLGLSIVKGMVELLGGKIWVVSKENEGSTFYFNIPYNPANPILKNEIIEENTGLKRESLSIILIVEDEMANFCFIKALLEDYSCNIIHAKNGKEAVETLNKNQLIDLVLMDLKMPVMSGFEATKEIRKMNKSVPIIAQSAYAMAEDIQKAMDIGCNDYLSKPISEEVLAEIMKKYILKDTV